MFTYNLGGFRALRFGSNHPQDIYAKSSVFLLNNQYNDVKTAVQGPGIVSACYPGACSEFHIGSFGVEDMREQTWRKLLKRRPGMYLPARTTYSTLGLFARKTCSKLRHIARPALRSVSRCNARQYM